MLCEVMVSQQHILNSLIKKMILKNVIKIM